MGQIGSHNTMNALAAIAAARHAGVPTKIAIEALNQFEGVARRMEVRGVVNGVTVYDDFAHHPTAIQTQFHHLVRTIPASGLIVANGSDKNLDATIAKGCWTPIEKFGPGHAWDFKRGTEEGQFDVLLNGGKKGEVTWAK